MTSAPKTETLIIASITYELVSTRATPVIGREMLTLRRPGGKVKYVAFRDGNGRISKVNKSPVQ